jgi:perosamine synthetase
MIPISKPFIGEEEKRAVMEVLDSGMLVMGPRNEQLEKAFVTLCGVKHAIATSSGTTALELALRAHGIGPEDEVLTPSFTFIASVNSILYTGARPVFVDVDAAAFNVDVAKLEQAITPKTKAILVVHLYGRPCEMDAIAELTSKRGLALIEDACQAVGATHNGRAVGSFGTGAFSLYATKNVMSGEGGMITTDDDAVADRARLLRTHGMRRRYHHDMLGYNYRMSDLHAAIGVVQMGRLAGFNDSRRRNASFLSENIRSVVTPQGAQGHVWHQYTVRLDRGRDRELAIKQLTRAGIGTGIFYPVPAHKQPYIQEMVGSISLPVTEQLAREVFSLPVHPQLSHADLERIATEVNRL